MEKDVATLLDAVTFQVSDMMAPATVLEAAGRHLLDRLDLTDPHRWAVTSALGSIVAARKALEAASEELLHVVAQDGADVVAVEIDNGEIVNNAAPGSGRCQDQYRFSQIDPPALCTRDFGHIGIHHGDNFQWGA